MTAKHLLPRLAAAVDDAIGTKASERYIEGIQRAYERQITELVRQGAGIIVRGVESGYAVVRSSHEGLLFATDAYGRVLGEKHSAPLPGSALMVKLVAADPVHTLYAATGDVLGWACVAAAVALRVLAGRSSRGRR